MKTFTTTAIVTIFSIAAALGQNDNRTHKSSIESAGLKGKVKYVKSQTNMSRSGNESSLDKLNNYTEHWYNEKGMTTEIKRNVDIGTRGRGKNDHVIFEYDAKGNLIKEENKFDPKDYRDGTPTPPICKENTYDDRGYLVKSTTVYNRKLSALEKEKTLYTTYKMDENGKEVERTNYNGKDQIVEVGKSKYDEKGNVIEYSRYDAKGKLLGIRETKYNAMGKPIERSETDKLRASTNNSKYRYDANGNEIQFDTESNSAGRSMSSSTKKAYDDKGRVIMLYVQNSGQPGRKTTMAYNEQGDVVERITEDQRGLNVEKNEYVYDTNGNWIEKKEVTTNPQGKMMRKTVREIQYR